MKCRSHRGGDGASVAGPKSGHPAQVVCHGSFAHSQRVCVVLYRLLCSMPAYLAYVACGMWQQIYVGVMCVHIPCLSTPPSCHSQLSHSRVTLTCRTLVPLVWHTLSLSLLSLLSCSLVTLSCHARLSDSRVTLLCDPLVPVTHACFHSQLRFSSFYPVLGVTVFLLYTTYAI